MSDAKIIMGDNFESGGGKQTVVKDGATVIQAKEVHLGSRQPALPVIPRDLQPLDDCFLGRDKELAELVKRLHPGKVVAVCGPGGMGKSALAAQAVHQLEENRFPDGIVFHSFYGQPETEQALQAVCAAFQVEAKAGLASTVRQVLSGKKALLILDGAEEADDLKAVLDLRSTCGVLITSRKRDDAQGFRLDLTPLEDEPAVEVLREHSGLAEDDDAVQGICTILDGWPVGLRIAGRYLGSRGESAAEYLKWLEQEPFKELGDGEHQEENAALLLRRSVAQVSQKTAFALSIIGVLAFAPFTERPIVALLKNVNFTTLRGFCKLLKTRIVNRRNWLLYYTDDDIRFCRKILSELVNFGLLLRSDEGWQVSHALVYTYVRTEMPLERSQLKELAAYYIGFCETQSKAGLEGYAHLDRERAHCLRLIEACLDSGLWQEVTYLVGTIGEYLERQGYWAERISNLEMYLTAVRQTGDCRNEALCLNALGYICWRCKEHEQALQCYKKLLPICRELDYKREEGIALVGIAADYHNQGKHEQALEQYKQGLSLLEELGDRQGEGVTLSNIGTLYSAKKKYEQALQYYEQSLSVTREAGDKYTEGETLNGIANIYNKQGKSTKALECHKQALMIFREVGDRAGEMESCRQLGVTYEELGYLAKAEEYISRAVQLAEAIDHYFLEKYREDWSRCRQSGKGRRSEEACLVCLPDIR